MNKADLIEFLEPFSDDIEIEVSIVGGDGRLDEFEFTPEYKSHGFGVDPDSATILFKVID